MHKWIEKETDQPILQVFIEKIGVFIQNVIESPFKSSLLKKIFLSCFNVIKSRLMYKYKITYLTNVIENLQFDNKFIEEKQQFFNSLLGNK